MWPLMHHSGIFSLLQIICLYVALVSTYDDLWMIELEKSVLIHYYWVINSNLSTWSMLIKCEMARNRNCTCVCSFRHRLSTACHINHDLHLFLIHKWFSGIDTRISWIINSFFIMSLLKEFAGVIVANLSFLSLSAVPSHPSLQLLNFSVLLQATIVKPEQLWPHINCALQENTAVKWDWRLTLIAQIVRQVCSLESFLKHSV